MRQIIKPNLATLLGPILTLYDKHFTSHAQKKIHSFTIALNQEKKHSGVPSLRDFFYINGHFR